MKGKASEIYAKAIKNLNSEFLPPLFTEVLHHNDKTDPHGAGTVFTKEAGEYTGKLEEGQLSMAIYFEVFSN